MRHGRAPQYTHPHRLRSHCAGSPASLWPRNAPANPAHEGAQDTFTQGGLCLRNDGLVNASDRVKDDARQCGLNGGIDNDITRRFLKHLVIVSACGRFRPTPPAFQADQKQRHGSAGELGDDFIAFLALPGELDPFDAALDQLVSNQAVHAGELRKQQYALSFSQHLGQHFHQLLELGEWRFLLHRARSRASCSTKSASSQSRASASSYKRSSAVGRCHARQSIHQWIDGFQGLETTKIPVCAVQDRHPIFNAKRSDTRVMKLATLEFCLVRQV